MSHFKLTSLLLVDVRNKNMNAACALAAWHDGKPFGQAFLMQKYFNPLKDNILSLVSKAISKVPPNVTDLTYASGSYLLTKRRMRSAFQTPWWEFWNVCRGKPYRIHRQNFDANDAVHKMMIQLLTELLDDHAHHADPCRWNRITLSIPLERLRSEKSKLLRDEEHTFTEIAQ